MLEWKKRKRAEVNIVPMVDVLTVLIFFFLITMQFKNNYSVDITPPTMDSAAPRSAARIPTIAVSKDGRYFFDDELINSEALKSKIANIGKSPDPSLILLADKDAPFHYVTAVIDLAKLADIRKMSIQSTFAE